MNTDETSTACCRYLRLLCDTHTLVTSVLFKVCKYYVMTVLLSVRESKRTYTLTSLFPPPYLLAVVAVKCPFAGDDVPILFCLYRLYRRVRFILLRYAENFSRYIPISWKSTTSPSCPNAPSQPDDCVDMAIRVPLDPS
jgi:hypothetical protein